MAEVASCVRFRSSLGDSEALAEFKFTIGLAALANDPDLMAFGFAIGLISVAEETPVDSSLLDCIDADVVGRREYTVVESFKLGMLLVASLTPTLDPSSGSSGSNSFSGAAWSESSGCGNPTIPSFVSPAHIPPLK